MTPDEHRALAELQIAESDQLFTAYRTAVDPPRSAYDLICHLRQSAMVHALLGEAK